MTDSPALQSLRDVQVVAFDKTGTLTLGRPVVGLYGYTNPVRYGPYGRGMEVVVDGYATKPGIPYPASMEYHEDGMARVTPDAVMDVVRQVLGQRGPE